MADMNYLSDGTNIYTIADAQARADITDTKGRIGELPIGEKSVDFTDVISVDNAINVNAKSVKVKLEPTQDLHGYDKPWAGGQGKNLLPYLINECGWEENNGGTTTLNNNELIVHCLSTVYSGAYSRPTEYGGELVPIITNNKPCYVSFDVVADIPAVIGLGWEIPSAQQFAISPTKQRISILYDNSNNDAFVCYNYSNEPVNVTLSNLMVSKTEETEYEPYANICDISGYSSVDITQKDTETNPTVTNTYTVNLNNTYYGGELDVTNGILTNTMGYISSYNDEVINEPWLSSMDEYVSGTVPTNGAEVVYPLSTPQTIQLTPTQIEMLLNNNVLYCNEGNISLVYYVNDVIGELEQQLQALTARVEALENG